jgi:hypothetical protein
VQSTFFPVSTLRLFRSIEEKRDLSVPDKVLSGLFQRALEIKSRHLRLLRPDEVEDEEGITSEDRTKILSEINTVVAANRIKIGPETFRYTPERRGSLLPIIINLVCIVAVVGGAFLISRYFNRREQSIISGPDVVLTAEGRVLEELRQQSEQQLKDKDRQISEIQSQLSRISQEQDKIRREAEASLQEREARLKEELDTLLAEEKAKLQDQGLSDDDIRAQLAALEQSKQEELDRQLEDIREEAAAQLAEKENAILRLEQEYNQNLEEAQTERQRLKEELSQREAELQAEAEAARREAETETARIQEELDALQAKRQEEQLILDQITASYDRIRRYIEAGQYPEALKSLESLGGFLNQADVSLLPAVQRRRSVDLFIIRSLKDLVERERGSLEQDATALIESANMLTRISDRVGEADSLLASGDAEGAKQLYLKAMAEIPSIQRSYEKLQNIELLSKEVEARALLSIIGTADRQYSSADYARALQSYEKALAYLDVDSNTAKLMLERIADAGYRLKASEQPAAEQPREEDAAKLAEQSAAISALRNEIDKLKSEQTDTLALLVTAEAERDSQRILAEERAVEKRALESDYKTLEEELREAEDLLGQAKSAQEYKAKMDQRIQRLRSAYDAFTGYSGAVEPAEDNLIDLIEIMLLLRKVIGSEAVRREYPTLYEDMDEYFDALSEEQRRAGYSDTLLDLIQLLEAALREDSETGLEAVWGHYQDDAQEGLMTDLLDSLQSLLK